MVQPGMGFAQRTLIMRVLTPFAPVFLWGMLTGLATEAHAQKTTASSSAQISSQAPSSFEEDASPSEPYVWGPRLRAGGRYDDVRMCVASPAGTKGGPAADISLFLQVPVGAQWSLDLDLPVMRPLLFAGAFQMLQFEPSVSLRYRHDRRGKVDPIFGPTLGLSLNYGPDYTSAATGDGREPSFFSLGLLLGAYAGLDFTRPQKRFNVQLGVTGYVIPLFSVNDPENHQGVVAGGTLDLSFRFKS